MSFCGSLTENLFMVGELYNAYFYDENDVTTNELFEE